MEKDEPPQLVTPKSVNAILSRIEAAQLTRVQEDISSQLSDILDNVNCVINHFQEELGYDLKEKAKSHQMEQKGKKRFILLEKIASFSKDAKTKEKHLYEILHWLGHWGDSLTYEIRNRKSQGEEEALDEWIEVMEKVLPLSLIATKGGIESLISLCSTLIEGQKKRAKASKCTFWPGWQEQSPQNSTSYPQPPSPEKMLQDKHTTCTRVSEVKSMLQELLDSTMFNQGDVRAIRYMYAVVENLNKALILQHKENRSLETKYKSLKIEMTKELSSQRLYFQKSLQILESKRDALLKQVEILGGKYHDLLLIKHALEFQLKKAESARGQAEDSAKILVDSPGPLERDTLPKKETVMEETQEEPKKEDQLFSPLSPSPMATAGDSGARPSTYQPLCTMTMYSRIADVYSSTDTESLQPVWPSLVDHKFPKKCERLMAETPGHKVKDQKDFFQEADQEKEGLQIKPHFGKQLSQESSRKEALESKVEHWEEELSWERRRQQWLEEEERWLQQQKKWALQEQEHQEKLRQWEMEDVAREQQQRLGQPGKEHRHPWREPEQPGEDGERMIFMTTSRWRDLEKSSLAPPPSRTQSAHQGRRPHLPRSPDTQQPSPGNQRTVSSATLTQKPRAHWVPTKPRKSASFPVRGISIQKVTQPPLQISPVTLKGKTYHMDVEAQRKNLQLLSEEAELGLPHYLRSRALELTITTMELNALRLQCLCHKYILYRRFQSLREEVINHIQGLRETGATYKAQNLYIFLENIDHQQNLQLQPWKDKQKDLEEKHRECLSSMVTMFPKLQLEWNVHLHTPVVTSPQSRKSKPPPSLLQHIHSSSRSCKQPLEHCTSKHPERVPLRVACQQGKQMEAMWKTDVTSSSHPIEKKTPASLPWDQLGGRPDIPRLLALDVHSSYHKSFMSLKARASATQRKTCLEPPDESAELVRKKSNESFPGTLKSRRIETTPVPTPSLSQ
ncbi:protein FAM186B isoform X1 [Equus przewalskii]|uniref:Protein FAM186B isoform X1 n=1 Tax=Equus przewalskii TaxID=9798 RepID=A0ABM2EQN0_EQUPR|nr:protein FAM186B isoform X1 [Equus caballus]XP_008520297.1 PREDICTED: protein FAM186B isoform X1 [Equus przewalskii]